MKRILISIVMVLALASTSAFAESATSAKTPAGEAAVINSPGPMHKTGKKKKHHKKKHSKRSTKKASSTPK